MKPEEIKLSDWGRIILGDVPPEFYAELFIRGMLVYLLLTVSLRLLGRRMSTQISLVELTAMVALASAIGVPMLAFDRGILPSFIIATIIIVLTRVIARINYKSQRFEKAVQGDVDALVKDSMLAWMPCVGREYRATGCLPIYAVKISAISGWSAGYTSKPMGPSR